MNCIAPVLHRSACRIHAPMCSSKPRVSHISTARGSPLPPSDDGKQQHEQQKEQARQNATMNATAKALRINERGRHIFLCAGATKPKCCDRDASLAAWDYLKKRFKELGLENRALPAFRTKADCLRICAKGPIAVVYPDQVYYHSCNPSTLERIIQEHVLCGNIVEEFQIKVE